MKKRPKKLAIDTFYTQDNAYTVGIIFSNWNSNLPDSVISCNTPNPSPYIPGEFYKRELPCILDLLKEVDLQEISTIIVDGYVWIEKDGSLCDGLGAKLYEVLNDPEITVIGVAKSKFSGCEEHSYPILRGTATKPLYIQSIGRISGKNASSLIKNMKGSCKLPDLLKYLDRKTKSLSP